MYYVHALCKEGTTVKHHPLHPPPPPSINNIT